MDDWLARVPHRTKVWGSIPGSGISLWSLHVTRVPVSGFWRYSGFVPHTKNMHGRLIKHGILFLRVKG